jgi:hypothetical protein
MKYHWIEPAAQKSSTIKMEVAVPQGKMYASNAGNMLLGKPHTTIQSPISEQSTPPGQLWVRPPQSNNTALSKKISTTSHSTIGNQKSARSDT